MVRWGGGGHRGAHVGWGWLVICYGLGWGKVKVYSVACFGLGEEEGVGLYQGLGYEPL